MRLRDGGIIDDLVSDIDDVLSVRDDIGAKISDVFIVERDWVGDVPGSGTAKITKKQMTPTPGIVDFSQNIRLVENGAVKEGDIILTGISKNQYEKKSDVDCSSDRKDLEKFYEVNGELWSVVSVTEKAVTWNVQLRRLGPQKAA